jgi:hypothetical protein
MGMQKFKALSLPSPPQEYQQSYSVQLIRALGLYFNQLDSTTPLIFESAQITKVPDSTAYATLPDNSLYRGVGEDLLRIKVNGVAFSPAVTNAYLSAQLAITLASANAYTNAQVANYVPLAGGTMTGTLNAPTVTATTVVASNLNSTNAIVSTSVAGNIRAPGMTLQVQQAIKTDTFTQASTGATYYAVPGLSVTITPTSATSKILVTCVVNLGSESYQGRGIVYRDGVPLGLGTANSLRTGVSFGFNAYDSGTAAAGDGKHLIPCTFTFLDSPASTSSITYSVSVSCYGVYGIAVNRSWTWPDTAEYDPCFSSTITVMEIAG